MPIKKLAVFSISASIVLLSGCASITGTKNEPVSVDTFYKNQEITGCDCKLVNDKGVWFTKTPGSVVIQKSYENLVITCTKDGIDTGSAIFESKAGGGAWGNILAGGPIGYVIDRSSGAGFDYPPTMNVDMGILNKLVERLKQEQAASSVGESKSGATASSTSTATNLATATLGSNSTSQKLRDLQSLRNDGVITEEEFQSKKQKLLEQM